MGKIAATTFNKIRTPEVQKCASISSIIIGALTIIFGILAFTHVGPFAAIGTTGASLMTGFGALMVLGGILRLYFGTNAIEKQERDLIKFYHSKSTQSIAGCRGNPRTGTLVGYSTGMLPVYSTKETGSWRPIPYEGITTSFGETISYDFDWVDDPTPIPFLGDLMAKYERNK